MATRRKRQLESKPQPAKKVHPWRPCPLGQHWVIAHPKHKTSKRGRAYVQDVKGHCRENRSRKDQLYRDDIHEVAARHFSKLTGPPALDNFAFKAKGNRYDHLIRGWTRYWNEVLRPADPLDPDVVKALIAVRLLKSPKELRDHFINLNEKEIADAKAGQPLSWREAIIKYKVASAKLIGRFDRYLRRLKGE